MQMNAMKSDMFFVIWKIAHEIPVSNVVHIGFAIMQDYDESVIFNNGHVLEQTIEVGNEEWLQ